MATLFVQEMPSPCNEACGSMRIVLFGNSCIDVNCTDDSGCGDLTVGKTLTESWSE